MSVRRSSLPLAAACLLALAGCGNAGSDPGGDGAPPAAPIGGGSYGAGAPGDRGVAVPEARANGAAADVRRAIDAFLTSPDPDAACSEVVTDRFVERTFGDRGGCKAARDAAGFARRARISRVRVDGEGAKAVVVARGGPYRGERSDVGLVRERGRWRIDDLVARVPVGP